MKSISTRALLLTLCLFIASLSMSQVGINTDNPQGALDITSSEYGLLIPRVSLTDLTVEAPVMNPSGASLVVGTLVFHDGSNAIGSGFYFWTGTSWSLVNMSIEPAWTLSGNTGTTNTDYLGTTDSQALSLRTSAIERAIIDANGLVGINVTPSNSRLEVTESADRNVLRLNHTGNNAASALQINNTNYTGAFKPALNISSSGRGVEINTQAGSDAISQIIFNSGNDRALYLDNTNTSNNTNVAQFVHGGLGIGLSIDLNNSSNTNVAQMINHLGVGRGQEINLSNSANNNLGYSVFHNGLGGIGQYIDMQNVLADRNSMGLLIQYNGTGTAGDGGGNALEVQHNGNNGPAVDIFVGDPTEAAGPSNSSSEEVALSVQHMATGTSSAGKTKTAISAVNHSEDPTLVVRNSSTANPKGIEVYTQPTSGSLATTVYAAANVPTPNGNGVAVWGEGGNYGVIGGTSNGASSSNFGVFSTTDSGALGVKSFIVDHPTKPTTHNLHHFSIESNEVLNVYRGNAQLDANGKAIVVLPEYFEAVNENPTYQLTGIGTAVRPYILEEIHNNQFVIAGAPNTKVSWLVHAQRNDPTLQYFENTSGEKTDVQPKPQYMQGKYMTPGAFGAPEEQGVFYRKPVKTYKSEAVDTEEIKPSAQNEETDKGKIKPSEDQTPSDASL